MAHIGVSMNTRENLLGCEIYINDNKALFQLLLNPTSRRRLSSSSARKLEWIEAKKACRAVQRKENADIDNTIGVGRTRNQCRSGSAREDNYLLPLRMAECSAKTLTAQNPSHQSATNLRIDGAEPVYFSRS